MTSHTGYSYCKPKLYSKYGENAWFNEVLGYLSIRYRPIEMRMLGTLRYVELHPRNKNAFSYEFGSIIRDVGSTFTSILDRLVRNTITTPRERYDIRDYREFLINEVKDIELIGAELNYSFAHDMVLPFDVISDPSTRINWWNAYNNLKHSEIDNYKDGCLSNAVYGIASLAILYTLMSPNRMAEGRLFSLVGYFRPLEMVKKYLFPK